MGFLVLKKSREKSVQQNHPWIFSGSVESKSGITKNGETAEILSYSGEIIAKAAYSEFSQITARIWSRDPDIVIDKSFLEERIVKANNHRLHLSFDEISNAYRIINAEADGIPGLIIDKYENYLVCQFLSAGAEFWFETIIEILIKEFNPAGIYNRSDSDSRVKEGLEKKYGIVYGSEPPERIEIIENGLKYLVDVKNGHKTGFYLDQKENRKKIKDYCYGKEVLNCFSYTGGFGIAAVSAGAHFVTNIDSSSESIELIEKNLLLNNMDLSKSEQLVGDVFKILRYQRDSGKNFDVIILDPPKFAESKNQLEGALRGYKDINLLAFKLLRKGGILITFSCSGHVTPELFRKVVSGAAIDSGKNIQQLEFLQQAADHPVMLGFAESFYLKGMICKVW